MKEIWRDIKGYDYAISNIGNVYSYISGKILKHNKDKNGYERVPLYKDGRKQYKQIHRLVAEAFLENPNNLPCVNHKNEILPREIINKKHTLI